QGLPDSDDFSNEGLYVVFTPFGKHSDQDTDTRIVGGYHGHYTQYSFSLDFSDTRHFAWIGDFGNLNTITNTLSHEVVEAMTDPNHDGITVPSDDPLDNEIADKEAEDFQALINGYIVQSYWSQQDGAYVVYDGNSQSVRVTDGELIIAGDQL